MLLSLCALPNSLRRNPQAVACNKKTYPNSGEAYRVLRRMQRTIRRGKLPIRVYYCKPHKGYHITSKPLIKGSE